jgi:predicted metal-dependent hydrolase
MNSTSNERLAAGIRLFNQGNFFEAHEVWEEIWKRAEGEEKIFYQGMIQAAAALVHVQRRNYPGAISLYLKSRPKLDRVPASWMGVDMGQFRNHVAQYFAALQSSLVPGRGDSPAEDADMAATGCPPIIKCQQG